MRMCMVQASYSQPDGGFFLVGMFTACDVWLQISKSTQVYFLHHGQNYVRKWKHLDCFFKPNPQYVYTPYGHFQSNLLLGF
jgi:hypothetical protein